MQKQQSWRIKIGIAAFYNTTKMSQVGNRIMGHQYAALAFTDEIKQVQRDHNSRDNYAEMEHGEDFNHLLSANEALFIAERDSFYMGSVSETGWPYVQHRGGPKGFMRTIDEKTIGFADFSGNHQYISTGNFRNNNRVSLFFMDYPNRRRLKMLGRVTQVSENDWETLAKLEMDGYRASVERGFLIHIEAFDWNCPQHITPRYTEEHIRELLAPLEEENRLLKEQSHNVSEKLTNETFGDGPLPLVISGVRQLTPRVRAYELRDPAGSDLPEVSAGSHLQMPITLENGEQALRHYSICSNPARRDIYEIAVLKESHENSGSKAIHAHYQLGQTVHCELPKNHFELHADDRPAVLIAGGIGITPIKAMAQALKARDTMVEIHYAGRSKEEMAFRDRLQREFGDDINFYSPENNQRLDIEKVLSNAKKETVFYSCGPNSLIEKMSQVAEKLNIKPERIRFERFTTTIDSEAKPIDVHLQYSGRTIHVSSDETILDALLDNSVNVPFSCKTGDCRTCAIKVIKGEVDHKDSSLSGYEREEQKLMCPCVSRANTDELIVEL